MGFNSGFKVLKCETAGLKLHIKERVCVVVTNICFKHRTDEIDCPDEIDCTDEIDFTDEIDCSCHSRIFSWPKNMQEFINACSIRCVCLSILVTWNKTLYR